ncbi:MAG TPA: transcription antitermination factor NusB [Bacillota bacterium]|nr:transcription antitermination factor NusB [Bacillota bacterium]
MKRSEFREKVVMLLYVHAMGGDFDMDQYEETILRRYQEILENLEKIDKVIGDNLVGYTIDRLNYVDLAIVENAVYEMFFTDTPIEIIINEAVNLTKKYSNLDDDAAKRFNNRLLDNIKTKMGK